MKDELVRAMTKDGFVNAVAVTTTGIVERARQIHKTLPTATAALGRLLTAASMMGNMQKVDDGSITLQLKGGGPLGRLKAAGLLSVFAIHLVSSPFVAKSLRLLDTVCGIIFTTKK